MLFQPYKSDFILTVIKEVEVHEAGSHWKIMKWFEVNNKHKNKDGKLTTTLSIRSFKSKSFPDGILTKEESRLCSHGGMQK